MTIQAFTRLAFMLLSALSEPCERLLSLIRAGVKAAVEAGTVLVRTRLEAVHDAHAAERLPRGVIRNVKHELTIALAELLFAPSLNTGHTLTPVSSDTGAHSAETLSSVIGSTAVTCVEASFVVVVASGKAGADRAAAQLWTIVMDDLIGCTVSITDSNLSDAIIDDAVGIHTVIGADTGADAVHGSLRAVRTALVAAGNARGVILVAFAKAAEDLIAGETWLHDAVLRRLNFVIGTSWGTTTVAVQVVARSHLVGAVVGHTGACLAVILAETDRERVDGALSCL